MLFFEVKTLLLTYPIKRKKIGEERFALQIHIPLVGEKKSRANIVTSKSKVAIVLPTK
jgi:hypothetical protein